MDLCLESVDILKKTLHRQWADETDMRSGVDSLLGRIAALAPQEGEEEFPAEAATDAHEEAAAKPGAAKVAPKALTAKQAAAQIRTVARPMSLNAYKVDVAQNLIERTLLQALG